MNPTPDNNSEPLFGRPSSHSSTESITTNNSGSSRHRDELPSETRTLHTLQNLRVAKAQEELKESSVRSRIAEANLEEALYDKLASQLMILPHRQLLIQIYNDGISWIAAYKCSEGEPVVGRGDSPQQACSDFDKHWLGTK
jgi:hypothetical protein